MRDKNIDWFDEGYSSYEKHPEKNPDRLFQATLDILIAYNQVPGHFRLRPLWKRHFMEGWNKAKQNVSQAS